MTAADDSLARAETLKQEWEACARSPYRDFYVASHPGWDQSSAWDQQAGTDAARVLL